VTEEKLAILRKADAIYLEEIRKAGLLPRAPLALGRPHHEPFRQRRKRGDRLVCPRPLGDELRLKLVDVGLERLVVGFEGGHQRRVDWLASGR
jgi:hypothetical protein